MKVSVLGAGRMGRIRAHNAHTLGATVLTISDPDPDRAGELAEEVGARVCPVEEVPYAELDALFLCTPPHVRWPGERALAQGVGLFVEKPLALSAHEAEGLQAALDASGAVSAVGYMNRYRPSVARLRAVLDEAPLLGIAATWMGGRYGVPWWARADQSGGPLNEQCTHLVDLVRHLGGEVVAVSALRSDDTEEQAAISLLLDSGATATLLYSCRAEAKLIGLRAYTPAATHELAGWDFRDAQAPPTTDKNAIFEVETAAFLEAVGGGPPPLCTLADALRTQRVVDAIRLSAREGRRVALGS